MNLKIILSSDNIPILPALKALAEGLPPCPTELYCLCATEAEALRAAQECGKIGALKSFRNFTSADFASVASLASQFLINDASGYLLFLSSNALPEKDCLKRLLDCLETDDKIAGVNPRMLTGWLAEKRIAFMGLCFDYQKKLHYLYEGIRPDNALANRERFFQIGHPGCLLLRQSDFARSGGLDESLGVLAFPSLCLQISRLRPRGFACLPKAQACLRYKLDSWNYCGAWDSILQRGRLETGNIRSDYGEFCGEDGIEYGVDSWLAEGPAQIPDLAESQAVRRWQEWRYHPGPGTLLAFLVALPQDEQAHAIELARNRPASLPQTLQYYKVQAEKLKALADESGLPIGGQIAAWQAKARRFHYGELKPGIELLKKAGIYNCALDVCPAIFDAWVEVAEKFEKLEISRAWPALAVLMPVWNPNPDFLVQAIESVIRQTYPDWQLCIADDASTKSEIRPILERFANEDQRIRVRFRDRNGHICRASNTALELVDAPFTAFLDHDDLLSPHALGEVASLIAQKPELAFIYTDDDRITVDNVRRNPVFRPDFDCDLSCMGHLSTYATGLIRKLGGLRIGTEGSQDQDLRIRVTELLDDGRIAHIPRILYHWRVHEESASGSFLAKPYVLESMRKVYLDAAARNGRNARLGDLENHKLLRVLYYPRRKYLCSVILLVDKIAPSARLLACVEELAQYADIEMLIQPLGVDSPPVRSGNALPPAEGIVSACNAAAKKAGGEILLFLAADLEPDADCRLEQLLEMALTPHVAMASGNIWHGDRLVSGGWYPDVTGRPFPLLRGMHKHEIKKSAWGQLYLPRHALGAPIQCMAVKREFCQPDQFLDAEYGPLATVDFGLSAMAQNKFVAMNPWVNWQLKVVPAAPGRAEMELLAERRGREIARCGLRNPNLAAAPDMDWTLIL